MSTSADQRYANFLDAQAVNNFREYLRIPSVHPDVNYDGCIKFLEKQAKGLGLPIKVFTCVPKKPIIVISWIGTEPSLPSVLLNSHTDVVPVFEEKWTHKPFSADIDDNGNIYARGAQDMKCVGIQYLEAIRRLRERNVKLKRTLHVSFVPDEEIGGVDGMRKFIKTKDFEDLNVGVALDEGMASPTEEFVLFYGERCIWHLHIHIPGHPGHGSLLLDDTAGEKLNILLNKFFEYRRQEKNKLKNDRSLSIGDVTTINLTQIKGGVQSNVIPPELIAVFDIRIPVTLDIVEFENKINGWCKEAGQGIWIEYEQKQNQVPVTKLDTTNPYWIAFKEATDELNLQITPRIFPGGTDSRYIREIGKPALGFSPMNKTSVLLHDHDEYLNDQVFLRGIEIYCTILSKLANIESTAV